MRYRLRFHLQEVDLVGEEIIIGRGSMGQVTIDDPMLSRRHIRIDLSGATPTVEDLRSRNGTQLNGRPLVDRAALTDGDRIRIGTQELMFLALEGAMNNDRNTSALRFCGGCAIPYPARSLHCPHCGAVHDEDGVGTEVRGGVASGWTFHLLSQVVVRAIEQGRLTDAERMMSRGVAELEDQLGRELEVEPRHVIEVAECSTRLGCSLRSARWIEVGARLYRRGGEAPSRDVLTLVDRLPADAGLGGAISALRHAGPGTRRAG
ncbi:MAG: FHA domain-containing protein [Deltaproteobacteria bacterium]|nr:FHA domain-containing protein [Deltaproteobacteria bacterium]